MISINIFITLLVFSFCLGYCFGRLGTIFYLLNKKHNNSQPEPTDFFSKIKAEDKENKKISIDERTFVTKVDIESYDKKFTELGEKIIADDNIDTSVSKLSKLKKK